MSLPLRSPSESGCEGERGGRRCAAAASRSPATDCAPNRNCSSTGKHDGSVSSWNRARVSMGRVCAEWRGWSSTIGEVDEIRGVGPGRHRGPTLELPDHECTGGNTHTRDVCHHTTTGSDPSVDDWCRNRELDALSAQLCAERLPSTMMTRALTCRWPAVSPPTQRSGGALLRASARFAWSAPSGRRTPAHAASI